MRALMVLTFLALQDPPATPAAEAPPATRAPAEAGAKAAATPTGVTETIVVGVSDDVFEDGVRAFEAGDNVTAANKMWHYLKGSEQTADHYEWAELYLARALLREGFTHGGLEYLYTVARERKRPELLPVALSIIEQVREVHPYDEELIDRDLLAGTDFGALPPANKSFVEYQQGRIDLIEGQTTWALRHFERLKRSGDEGERVKRYALRARLAVVLADLRDTHDGANKAKKEKRAAALKQLEEIAAVKDGEFSVLNDARRVLAQLYFEEGRFDEALKAYDGIKVPFLSEQEADLFLEKAWARYYQGDIGGTLGILLTLDAPSYRKYFRPERFILKALAYKQVCHYAAAKAAAREFLRRYGSSLAELRRSRDPLTDPTIRAAAVQRKKPRRMFALLDALQRERGRIERFSDEHGLATHLGRVYELKIAQVNRDLDRVVEDEAAEVASELLDYEEQARLVDYEVSLEVFRRVKKGSGKTVAEVLPPIPLGSREVYYRFEGEYWNDELHDYQYRIDNRCFGEELFVQ
jgi:tetratricopeptide (TPR) repeat protein